MNRKWMKKRMKISKGRWLESRGIIKVWLLGSCFEVRSENKSLASTQNSLQYIESSPFIVSRACLRNAFESFENQQIERVWTRASWAHPVVSYYQVESAITFKKCDLWLHSSAWLSREAEVERFNGSEEKSFRESLKHKDDTTLLTAIRKKVGLIISPLRKRTLTENWNGLEIRIPSDWLTRNRVGWIEPADYRRRESDEHQSSSGCQFDMYGQLAEQKSSRFLDHN